MDHYHIPKHIQGLITSYFGGIKSRFQTTSFTTEWQLVEKGIIMGCTISPILFIMGMNLIISQQWIQRTKDHHNKSTAGNQGIHGWPYCDHINWRAGKMGPRRWHSSPRNQGAWWFKRANQQASSSYLFKGRRSQQYKTIWSSALVNGTATLWLTKMAYPIWRSKWKNG